MIGSPNSIFFPLQDRHHRWRRLPRPCWQSFRSPEVAKQPPNKCGEHTDNQPAANFYAVDTDVPIKSRTRQVHFEEVHSYNWKAHRSKNAKKSSRGILCYWLTAWCLCFRAPADNDGYTMLQCAPQKDQLAIDEQVGNTLLVQCATGLILSQLLVFSSCL